MSLSRNSSEFTRCADCNIRYRAVCSTCDSDELSKLEDIKYYRTYDPGQPIMFEGDEMHFVAHIARWAGPDGRSDAAV